MKYNGIQVPESIRTNRIASAFENAVDWDKVQQYATEMRLQDYNSGQINFPPIMGFPSVIDEDDMNNPEFGLLDIDAPYEKGDLIWKVTDGHHRTLAAIEAGIYMLDVTLDYSCITSENELKQFS